MRHSVAPERSERLGRPGMGTTFQRVRNVASGSCAGSKPSIARSCGVQIEHLTTAVYVLAGTLTGIAGVLEFATLIIVVAMVIDRLRGRRGAVARSFVLSQHGCCVGLPLSRQLRDVGGVTGRRAMRSRSAWTR